MSITRPAPPRRRTAPHLSPARSTRDSRLDAERVFLEWLADPLKPESVLLDGAGSPLTALTSVLGVLCTSSRMLPPSGARLLGMTPGTTIGVAATELLLAVNDPAGPRCRSYRSAVFYLQGRPDLAEALTDL